VNEIHRTPEFIKWLKGLKDITGKARIETRIARLGMGRPGDVKPARDGVSEMRIDCGPGYRVYFTKRGFTLIILLAGGDKSTQDRDIETAIRMARNL
jgi:putative addiction module killer protein